ncbi:MAG TPA: efflux transporter periplasmic adaptor subunit, partial [Xanthomonadaceae bacterium]|nr:efflux transporter periplasmic adaptor subunit [Xanthomonadaceae bacterium]
LPIDVRVKSRARVVLDNRDGQFTPGLYARVRLPGSGRFNAVLVDDKAVLTDQDRKYVYVVDKAGKAERRDVRLGRLGDGGLRVVESGLKAGDKVIVDGLQKVFMPGMPVQAHPLQPAADAAPGRTAMN